MLKIFTDFNARTQDDVCWLLRYEGADLANQAAALALQEGDKVILYQDEDDFEVSATSSYRYVDALGDETWIAIPDWTKINRNPAVGRAD